MEQKFQVVRSAKVRFPVTEQKAVQPRLVTPKLQAKKGSGKSKGGSAGISMNLNNAHRTTLRFEVVTLMTQTPITIKSILGALGGVCTVVNTTVTLWASAFRINRIKCSPPAGGECNILWVQNPEGETKDDCVDASLPTGITISRTLTTAPPRGTLGAMWHSAIQTSSNQLLTLSSNVGAVIDVDISFQLGGVGTTCQTATCGTAPLGFVGYGGFDTLTASKCSPLGRLHW